MILLEGNIGVGKSTVGKLLHEEFGCGFIEEPIKDWKTEFSEDLLDLFYRNMPRWSFAFQIAAFTTRAKTWDDILKKTDHSTVVLERSIFCDRYVFAKNCHESGLMKDVEWELYCKMWDWLNKQWCAEPDHIIYLRAPASLCRLRIEKRGRLEEDGISLEYLLQLEQAHDRWLVGRADVTIIDAFGIPPIMIANEIAQTIRRVSK